MTVRLAMWSGPRSLSTAMMRSFGSRADTRPVDEPLYAAFLARTGIEHPGRDAVLASQPTDPGAAWAKLANTGSAVPYQYEKHMSHHWLDGDDPAWLSGARHGFLLRDPRRILASYARVRETPTAFDLGLLQQRTLFDHVTRVLGQPPVVVDADRLLAAPRAQLQALCAAWDVPFDDAMLSWAPGPRPEDGVWAPYWYASVERSTGFEAAPGPVPDVPEHLLDRVEVLLPAYQYLLAFALTTS